MRKMKEEMKKKTLDKEALCERLKIEVTKVLVEHGANVKAKNNDGKNPYDTAREEREWKVAKYLPKRAHSI